MIVQHSQFLYIFPSLMEVSSPKEQPDIFHDYFKIRAALDDELFFLSFFFFSGTLTHQFLILDLGSAG